MSEGHDLEILIKSHLPIILIESHEEARMLQLISRIGIKQYKQVHRWSITSGLVRQDVDISSVGEKADAEQVLWQVRERKDGGIYVLCDYHPYLNDPLHIRLIKDIALAHEQSGITLILLSHRINLPPELSRLSASAHFSMPTRTELENIVRETAREWLTQHKQSVRTDQESFNLLVQNLSGLTTEDARRLARTAIFNDGSISASDIPNVMKAKHSLLRGDDVLGFEFDTARFSEVGGLKRLKHWLEQRKAVFQGQAGEHPLDPPKGILLLGVQGGGKSLAAKAVAGLFSVPLLRLDFASIYNKYHGESERNLREALKTAESMAPCVLWIDEIEKGISTTNSDGGTSQRILGTLLTWMAERSAPVFMVATANDIERLPAELVRKGRFDEIFFVDLPDKAVRQEIFAIHLARRKQEVTRFNTAVLAELSEGFSGAEIEQAVVSALYATHAQGVELANHHIEEEILGTRPLSLVMHEKVSQLRQWASERTVPAS
jgi:SpoVK/Ycf46/Vps4 family AAA+-type ATPase